MVTHASPDTDVLDLFEHEVITFGDIDFYNKFL
jgi:hypothetical protein